MLAECPGQTVVEPLTVAVGGGWTVTDTQFVDAQLLTVALTQ
ncbi:MAG: hypothetical protein ABSH14_15890 [Verrucomicrobiia bacterium]|jgi:hypothetical protein